MQGSRLGIVVHGDLNHISERILAKYNLLREEKQNWVGLSPVPQVVMTATIIMIGMLLDQQVVSPNISPAILIEVSKELTPLSSTTVIDVRMPSHSTRREEIDRFSIVALAGACY
nr:hypothetical protein HmN_000850600 [Hymenolepis microstoma]